ncbi:repetitive proline-rich cell wall protein 1-like, partial [Astyanax mexicanus]
LFIEHFLKMGLWMLRVAMKWRTANPAPAASPVPLMPPAESPVLLMPPVVSPVPLMPPAESPSPVLLMPPVVSPVPLMPPAESPVLLMPPVVSPESVCIIVASLLSAMWVGEWRKKPALEGIATVK